jgi:hypothetical protein
MPSAQNSGLTGEVKDLLAHFSFCALVALHIARQDGRAGSALSDHLFLTCWLDGAQRLKLFPRKVASVILSLQILAKKSGPRAQLPKKLQRLWEISSGSGPEHSDVARLNAAIIQLKDTGWSNVLLSQSEWCQSIPPNIVDSGINAIFTERMAIESAFNKRGSLISPLSFLIYGDNAVVIKAFTDASLTLHATSDPQLFQLLPSSAF